MKTTIRDLRFRAEFQKPQRQPDGRGGWKIGGYATYVTLWTKLEARRNSGDRERTEAQQPQTGLTYWVTVRYRRDISADMRVLVDGKKLYAVKNPYDPDGMRRWLTLECEERHD